jgi:hypothetical protein
MLVLYVIFTYFFTVIQVNLLDIDVMLCVLKYLITTYVLLYSIDNRESVNESCIYLLQYCTTKDVSYVCNVVRPSTKT